jgi:pheromone shutdown-related protein TraB
MINNTHHTRRLLTGGKEVVLVGTAHVSRQSAELVASTIEAEKPDTVCVELCQSRFQSIREKANWQNMNIFKVVKEKKAFLLLANLLLASFQKRIASQLNIQPGAEMIQAIDSAEAVGAAIHLADRDIRVTLARAWRDMRLWDKIKLVFQLVLSVGTTEEISEADVEQMKQQDMLQMLLADVGQAMPSLKAILIDERDRYLAYKIQHAPGQRIVAVVGAGHVPGILANWEKVSDIEALESIPPGRQTTQVLKWLLPAAVLTLFILGFFYGGTDAGTHMLRHWIVANGLMAGAGALIALAHPITILASILAAPLTSLNPMIAAGWVSGLVETMSRKPKVRDLENLPDDIISIRGFWRNKVTRILLVVVFTNLGSSVGTLVAIPLMVKVL